ncbi:MAG TPA: hypothetical protein VIX17_24450, partial [Pyrinomonadaceae bacterium]
MIYRGRCSVSSCKNELVLLDGGGRGRPRSDRRAFVDSVKGSLFGGKRKSQELVNEGVKYVITT